jgi:hypothetical protein
VQNTLGHVVTALLPRRRAAAPARHPDLHDIPTNLPFRVEMWDRHDQHIRWVISASSSVSIGHVALDVAIANYPSERFTLRNRALVIREYKPEARPL